MAEGEQRKEGTREKKKERKRKKIETKEKREKREENGTKNGKGRGGGEGGPTLSFGSPGKVGAAAATQRCHRRIWSVLLGLRGQFCITLFIYFFPRSHLFVYLFRAFSGQQLLFS